MALIWLEPVFREEVFVSPVTIPFKHYFAASSLLLIGLVMIVAAYVTGGAIPVGFGLFLATIGLAILILTATGGLARGSRGHPTNG
jgi:hypothetical protein